MPNSITACRSCGDAGLQPVLSLGETPLANALLTAEQLLEPEEIYPLAVVFCPCCTLMQITETVPPEKLFREYFYLSSFSDTLLKHAEELATHLMKTRQLDENSLVAEVASNDGYLLQYYERAGVAVLGIEPARNVADVAIRQRGIPTVNDFFSAKLAFDLAARGQSADCIHAHNVLAHVADLNDVVAGFATLLKPDGVVVVEVPYVRDLIERCEFDTIYHEHLCYFSFTALNNLFGRQQLTIVDVEHHDLHGGTLRLYAGHTDNANPCSSVATMLAEEARSGLSQLAFYRDFSARVNDLRRQLTVLLHDLKSRGKRIAAYGASAKGSTLLNYFQLGADVLDFVVDRSTVKQGYYTPGTHLPIYAPDKLLADMPDYVLLLTWNFATEILAQQSEYRARGGKFVVPIPTVQVI